jgi:hypothetical protein
MSPKTNGISNRLVVLIFCVFYIVSATLLFTASLFTSSALPAWGGPMDVIMALVIVLFAFWFYAKTGKADLTKYIQFSYSITSLLPALVFIVLWLLQKGLDFNIVLTGLAWRIYILFQILPRAIYLWNEPSDE